MTELLEFRSGHEDVVLVEVENSSRASVTRGGRASAAVVEATESLDHVVGRLGPVIKGMVSELRSAADWPDSVEVEFSVRISADSNVVIAKAGGEANFRINLKWSRNGAG
jgi:Trypsin-co-occurring domain 1